MFYSQRDVIWSLVWIALMSILALMPFQMGNGKELDSPQIPSSPQH